jgi:hypothetical protein
LLADTTALLKSLAATIAKSQCADFGAGKLVAYIKFINLEKMNGEVGIMIEVVAAIEVIKFASSSVGLIDKVYDS